MGHDHPSLDRPWGEVAYWFRFLHWPWPNFVLDKQAHEGSMSMAGSCWELFWNFLKRKIYRVSVIGYLSASSVYFETSAEFSSNIYRESWYGTGC